MQNFIRERSLLDIVFKKLELMEIEGKHFVILKSPVPEQQRARTDKVWNLHLANIDKLDGYGNLKNMVRFLTYLPFELNCKQSTELPMNL